MRITVLTLFRRERPCSPANSESVTAPGGGGGGGSITRWLNARRRLPLALLLIGMSTVFIFGNDRGYLHRDTWEKLHNTQHVSSHVLTMAVNLSPNHHFLQFMSRGFDIDGNIDYDVYNRFPPVGYVLIKLVTLPFGDDLSSRIYVAQIFMVVFFVGTAIMAFLSLCRLTSNRWIVLAATLTVFSSTQLLRFSDTIAPEMVPDLFGFSLVFHGIVIFVQEGRFRQLMMKSCLAVLLGWHVLALLLAFIILSLAKEIIESYKVKTVREIFSVVLTSRYFMLGIVSLGLGVLVVAYNMGNEYYALNVRGSRQLALSDLPSFRSIIRRTGIAQQFADRSYTQWVPFFEVQLRRIGLLSVPFALPGPTISITDLSPFRVNLTSSISDVSWIRGMTELQEFYIGIAVIVACIIGMIWVRQRLLTATAILSGFCWAIPIRTSSGEHAWEAMYYLGIPLFFYILVLSSIRKWLSEKLMPFVSIIALLVFILSSYQIGNIDYDYEYSTDFQDLMFEDYSTIRKLTEGKNIFVPASNTLEEIVPRGGGAVYGLHYYLSGRGIIFNNYGCDHGLDKVDFMILTRRDIARGLLTPDNQMVFLYDLYAYERRIDEVVEKEEPVIRADFDVYLTDDRKLIYVSDRCNRDKARSLFLGAQISLNIYPVDVKDIPDPIQGYEHSSFNFVDNFIADTKRHIVIIDLPDYEIASISTGQYTDERRIWGGRFFGPDYSPDADLIQQMDQVTASDRPIIRDRFDIYLIDETNLKFIREPCHNSDISDDFFVHIFPVDFKDLPDHRRQSGFDNLDFVFVEHGTRDGLKCAAMIKLPDYDIANIRTGQYTDRGQIWRGESAAIEHDGGFRHG